MGHKGKAQCRARARIETRVLWPIGRKPPLQRTLLRCLTGVHVLLVSSQGILALQPLSTAVDLAHKPGIPPASLLVPLKTTRQSGKGYRKKCWGPHKLLSWPAGHSFMKQPSPPRPHREPSGSFHGLPRWGSRKVFKCSWGNESQHAQKGTPQGCKMITMKQNLGVELKDALHLEHWKVREESFRLLFTLQWRTLKGNER